MQQRNPIAQALLVLIPFYILYWLIVTASDMRRRGGRPPTLALILVPLFGQFFIVAGFILLSINESGSSSTAGVGVGLSLLSILLSFIIIICQIFYYYKFANTAQQVTGGKTTTGINFLCFVLLSPIAVYLIQDALNQTSGSFGPANPAAGAPVAHVTGTGQDMAPPTSSQNPAAPHIQSDPNPPPPNQTPPVV